MTQPPRPDVLLSLIRDVEVDGYQGRLLRGLSQLMLADRALDPAYHGLLLEACRLPEGENANMAAFLLTTLADDWTAVFSTYVDPQTGDTPLHAAVARCRLEAIDRLVAAGADPMALNRWYHTPLDGALDWKGHHRLQEALVATVLDSPRLTAENLNQALMRAAGNGQLGSVRALAHAGAFLGEQPAPEAMAQSGMALATPLALACLRSGAHRLAMVRFLLKAPGGTAAVNAGWAQGGQWTAMAIAASRGAVDVLTELMDAGAAANPPVGTSPGCHTPLMAAAGAGEAEAMAMLLRAGADPRATDAEGRTALHALAGLQAPFFIAMLGSNPEDDADARAWQAKAVACMALLLDAGVDPLQRTTAGQTALDLLDANEARGFLGEIRATLMEHELQHSLGAGQGQGPRPRF